MQLKQKLILLATLSTLLSTGATSCVAAENTNEATEARSTLSDQQSVAVTIYNSNLALVKDTRKVQLKNGINTLALRDVSAQIRPETALLRSINAPNSLTLLEQNFDFDLLTPEKLLEKYVGKTVRLIKIHPTTGAETSEQATVLSANKGVVLKVGNRIETGVAPNRIVFDDVPANLRDRPTLVTQINNNGATNQTVELSYLTGGLGWKADYVAELNNKEDALDLSGWVTLTNTSGASYKNAKLQLVAGDVNRVQPNTMDYLRRPRNTGVVAAPITQIDMAEETLLEYHLYTLDRPTTIAENQTKQVALLSAGSVPVRKEMLLYGDQNYYLQQYGLIGEKLKVSVFVEFDNKETSKLGLPLPQGIMRVYKKDSAGNAQFVGEDNIDHTPKNEKVRLKLGESFDVTADKKQTEFKLLPNPQKGHSAYESAFEFTLKNAKKEKMTVLVQEPIGGDWRIVSESHPHQKANSHLAVWKIDIPAEGKTTLTYRVQTKY